MHLHSSGDASAINDERAASAAAPSQILRLATRGKDNATSLAEQARTAESLARQHHRTGLQMAGSLGFNELSMARHLTVVARSFMEGARRHA